MQKRSLFILALTILLIGFFSAQDTATGQLVNNVGFSQVGGFQDGDLPIHKPTITPTKVKFAIIGDYGAFSVDGQQYPACGSQCPTCVVRGTSMPCVQAVADLVDSLDVDFIVTAGDNNYGGAGDFDVNVGQFYGDYISESFATNRFFPTVGNTDYAGNPVATLNAYYNFFTFPNGIGNRDYYDFVKDNIHFFVLNSDQRSTSLGNCNPAGRPFNDPCSGVQDDWLRNGLQNSEEDLNVVLLHHPPYVSTTGAAGGTARMQWPFSAWGADVVIGGHWHHYERLEIEDVLYFVNGLGGSRISAVGPPRAGSMLRFSSNQGAQIIEMEGKRVSFTFIDIEGVVRDSYTLFV